MSEAPARQCTAKSKRSGARCRRRPVLGADVCPMHGGKAPQVKAAAGKRIEAQEVARDMVTLGLPIDVDPTEALLQEVRRTAGHVAWLAERVQQLPEEDLTWGLAQHQEGISAEGPVDVRTHKAGGHAVYQMYLTEREHLAKVSALAIKAGVDQRRIELAEHQALQVAGLIRRVLAGIHLTPQQQEAAHAVVVTELRALDQGGQA